MGSLEINRIIEKQVSIRGYHLEKRESLSSNSVYFRISSGCSSLLFRVSDHGTNKNIITLRTDKKPSIKEVENFVKNRCDGLSRRQLKEVLNLV